MKTKKNCFTKLSSFIKEQREKDNLSKKELANKSKLDINIIEDVENRLEKISIGDLYKVSLALNLTLNLDMVKEKFLNYKGYIGSIKYSILDKSYYGKIVNIPDSLSYESKNLDELESEFQDVVNDYIDICQEIGKKP